MTAAALNALDVRALLRPTGTQGRPAWADPRVVHARSGGPFVMPLPYGVAVRVSADAVLTALTSDAQKPAGLSAQDIQAVVDGLLADLDARPAHALWFGCHARRAQRTDGSALAVMHPCDPVQVAVYAAAGTAKSFVVSVPARAVMSSRGAAGLAALAPVQDLTAVDVNCSPAAAVAPRCAGPTDFTFKVDGEVVTVRARTLALARRNLARRATGSGHAVRHRARARSTATVVTVQDSHHPDADVAREDGAGRWVTLCEDHGELCHHATLRTAREFAAAPQQWCESCRDTVD